MNQLNEARKAVTAELVELNESAAGIWLKEWRNETVHKL
jgi:hypothetical protein